MDFSTYCTPAFLYFFISILYLIYYSLSNFNLMSFIFNVIFIMLWSWLLNFLCSLGLNIISWLIILLPFFVLFK